MASPFQTESEGLEGVPELPVVSSNGHTEATPSTPVILISAGWHDVPVEGEKEDAADPRTEPRFRLIFEFEGPPPPWPMSVLFDGTFSLTPRAAADTEISEGRSNG